jgi:hypothetical protein
LEKQNKTKQGGIVLRSLYPEKKTKKTRPEGATVPQPLHTMPPAKKRPMVDPSTTVYKLQGGTGKHVDGDVAEPLQGRPFQVR